MSKVLAFVIGVAVFFSASPSRSEAIDIDAICNEHDQRTLDKTQSIVPKYKKKILGGTVAKLGQYPWQVSLGHAWVGNIAESHFCGGVIISQSWLLTAAHCVAGKDKEQIKVVAGTINLSESNIRHNVDKIVIPTGYVSAYEGKDIAVIKLKEKLEISDTIKAVELPGWNEQYSSDTTFNVSGFGGTNLYSDSSVMLYHLRQVPFIESWLCDLPASYGGHIADDMICAGFHDGKKDACQGDSGSGLMLANEKGNTVSGLVSWACGCGKPLKFGVYTNVAKYNEWITQCIQSDGECD